MAQVLVTEQYLSDTADAIRSRIGGQDTYKPSEFADAINSIVDYATVTQTLTGASSSSSKTKVVKGESFTADITPDSGYRITAITVTMGGTDITGQVFKPGVGAKEITANGTYSAASDNLSGYDTVTVSVPSGGSTPSLQTKSVSYTPTTSAQSAQVTADSGYDGLEQVNVSVGAIPSQYIVPSGSQTLTENDTYDVTALAEVVVNVASGGSTVQTHTGTFTGGDARTQTFSCPFEPDIIYIHGTTTDASLRATETFLLVRDTIQWVKYYSSTSNTSSFGYGIRHNISGLDPTANTSYTYQTTYSNGTITMYAYSNQDRYFFKSGITYSYKLIKYTA